MKDIPENPLRIDEISFFAGTPLIGIQCSELLLPAAYAFRDNVRRNVALAELPARLAGWSALTQFAQDVARFTTGIPFDSDVQAEGSAAFDPQRAAEFDAAHKKVWAAIG